MSLLAFSLLQARELCSILLISPPMSLHTLSEHAWDQSQEHSKAGSDKAKCNTHLSSTAKVSCEASVSLQLSRIGSRRASQGQGENASGILRVGRRD